MAIIGIDLGTTNSLVAIYENGDGRIINNGFGNSYTPSVISLLESDEIVIGKVAKERLISSPTETIEAFKREMGTTREYTIRDKRFTPVELSSLLLKNMVHEAESELNEVVSGVAISVPAYFSNNQRKATVEAASLADINVIGLINEPTAAALAYHLHDTEIDKTICVIDLGGGTFDVSILEIFESSVEVLAIAGDNHLGGIDIDKGIASYLCEKYNLNYKLLNEKERNKINYVSEQFKKGFDSESFQNFEILFADKTLELNMSIKEFKDVCKDILVRLRYPIKKAIMDAKIKTTEIDEIVLVGGSTKMPIVKDFVEKLFQKETLSYLNPEEVVAKGASVYAALRQENKDLSELIMTDVSPFTLGVEVIEEIGYNRKTKIFSPLIERNMTVPISREHIYAAIHPEQKKINIRVYQGEHRNPEDNIYLGNFMYDIVDGSYAESALSVRFTYDRNGILEVETKHLKTGVEKKGVLLNPNNLSEDDIEVCIDKIRKIKIHPLDSQENVYLISRAEKLFELLAGEQREQVNRQILVFESALSSEDKRKIRQAKKDMEDFLKSYEELY